MPNSNSIFWPLSTVVVVGLIALASIILTVPGPHAIPLASAHVKVTTEGGHGSATHIGDGYFVTAAHVIRGKSSIKVGDSDATVLWSNEAYDIALLQGPTDTFDTIPMVCAVPEIGTVATAYGNPMDLADIVTTLRIAGEPRGLPLWKHAIPVDGALAPGMSGGAVVVNGTLVGVIVGVSIANLAGLPTLYGVGFIVPSSIVCELMART